jgi:hypothetical protein
MAKVLEFPVLYTRKTVDAGKQIAKSDEFRKMCLETRVKKGEQLKLEGRL